jgi:CHASE3 domain sensor protein
MKSFSSSFLGNFTFLLGALLIATTGVLRYSASSAASEASAHARVAQQIVTTLDELTEQMVRSESDQRGFLLTRDEAFVRAREHDHVELLDAVAMLRRLVAQDPKQLAEIDKINVLLVARNDRFLMSAEERRVSGLDTVIWRLAGTGKRAADTDAMIEALRAQAVAELERSLAEEEAQQSFASKALLMASAIGLLVLLPAYGGFYLQSRARDRSESKLRLINERLPGVLYQARRGPQGKFSLTYVSGFQPGRSRTAPRSRTGNRWSSRSTSATSCTFAPSWRAPWNRFRCFVVTTGYPNQTVARSGCTTKPPWYGSRTAASC